MQTGWQYLEEKKAYFYLKTGKMAVNRTIDGATINSKGYAKMTYADKAMVKATEKAEEILATITNDSMTDSQKLRAAYDYMCSRSRFSYVTWRAFQVYDGWEYDYAYEIYTKHGGNCYNFACGFAMMAKVIGYDAYVVRGRVPGSRDGAGDGLTRHACVKINGLYYDPEAQFAGWATGIYGYSTYPMTFQILGSRKI
jgi:transglutaminase-like putative cysteine protease